jgi:hypothetical protein
MTPTFHENPITHDQHLETILFQCQNMLAFGDQAKRAPDANRRAAALDCLKIKARCLFEALESAHLGRREGADGQIAIPFPVGEKVRICNATHMQALGQVVALRRSLGNVDVQLATGEVVPVRNCDLEKA